MNKLIKFITPYKKWLVITITLSSISTFLIILNADLVRQLIDIILIKKNNNIYTIVISIIGVIFIGMFITYIQSYTTGLLSIYTIADLRKKCAEHIIQLPIRYIENKNVGNLTSILTNNIDKVQTFLQRDIIGAISALILFLVAFLYLLFMNWKLLIFTTVLIPGAIWISNLLSKPLRKLSDSMYHDLSDLNSFAGEAFTGIEVIKTYNLKQHIVAKYSKMLKKVTNTNISIEQRMNWIGPIGMILQAISPILCTIYGGFLVIHKELTVGELISFITILNYIIQPANEILRLISSIRSVGGAVDQIFNFLDEQAEYNGSILLKKRQIDPIIEFKNVYFAYDSKNVVLQNISFKITSQQKVVILGANGSGKSSLFKLICLLYKHQQGNISIYGQSIEDIELKSLRSFISIIPQDILLFPISIAENIGYELENVTIDDVVNAAKLSGAHDFIQKSPKGYDTLIGENGIDLSGGEKQRIAIARAIAKNTPIILFDEPTSALDVVSEKIIKDLINNLAKDKTIIIITHNISYAQDADEVFVLEHGFLVQKGTHMALIKQDGPYRYMYNQQISKQTGRV